MSGSTKPAIFDAGKAVGLALLPGVMIAAVARQSPPGEALMFGLLLLPLMPVPVAYLTARHGVMVGVAAGLTVGALCTGFTVATGSSVGLLVFLVTAIAGLFAGVSFKRGVNLYRTLVLLTLLLLGIMLVWSGTYLVSAGVGPAEALRDVTADVAENSTGLYAALGLEESSVDEMRSAAEERAPYLIPAVLMVLSGLVSIATVALSRLGFRLMKEPFPADIKFSELRLHFGFVYAYIAGLVLNYLLSGYLPAGVERWSEAAGQNLIIISEALFFIQGVAIAAWFLKKRRAPGSVRIAVYAGVVLAEALLNMTSLIGVFDVFIDFRRRYGGQAGKENNRNGRGDY